MTAARTLKERCVGIELLVLDVDGVLTAGGIVYAGSDLEAKVFHVRDGTGLKCWHEAGKQTAIITGRRSPAVERRGSELKIAHVRQGISDKTQAFADLLAATGLRADQAAAISDDLPELGILVRCGLAVAVADASPEIRSAAHYVTRAAGGCGAVRETIELILRCQERWQALVETYRG